MFDANPFYKYVIIAFLVVVCIVTVSPSVIMTAATLAILVNFINLSHLLHKTEIELKAPGSTPISTNVAIPVPTNVQTNVTQQNTTPKSGYVNDVVSNQVQTQPHKVNKQKDMYSKLVVHDEELKDVDIPETVYKGAVDAEITENEFDLSTPVYDNDYTGNERIAALNLKGRGKNAERQMSGAYNGTRKLLGPILREEMHNAEYEPWWGRHEI